MLTAVFLLFPRYNLTTGRAEFDSNIIGATTISPSMEEPTTIGTETQPIQVIEIETRGIDEIDQALGLQNTIGFIVPLSFLFLVLGFLVLILSSHWERMKLFY